MAIGAGVDLAVGEGGDVRDLSVFEGSGGFSASWSLAVLLVGCEVEGDEEEEVGADDAHACKGGEFLSGAFACIRHPREVCRGEVGVRRKVDEA